MDVLIFDRLCNLRSHENDSLKTGTLGQLETFDYDDVNRFKDIKNKIWMS
ncbi:MAG: hypothetical protein ACJASU_001862 [Cognaticolwellia sp.]|jgi:hypothetical protein